MNKNNQLKNFPWLPDKKFYEFAYHKHQNPEVQYHNWQPWDQWDYPDRDILRFEHLIKNQLQYITNKKIIDVGCHLGYTSLFCLHNAAKSVTGINIRSKELEIAREICQLAGYQNYKFLLADINNLQELSNICSEHQTAFISGIMYHVNNHYAILQTLADSSIETIIVESFLTNELLKQTKPIIEWKFEDSLSAVNGFYRNKTNVFVGIPNVLWFEQAFKDLDYNISYNQIIEYTKPNGAQTIRCIITAQKS